MVRRWMGVVTPEMDDLLIQELVKDLMGRWGMVEGQYYVLGENIYVVEGVW